MKKSDKYPYRPYSNALTKDDSWIMQNMVVFLDNLNVISDLYIKNYKG